MQQHYQIWLSSVKDKEVPRLRPKMVYFLAIQLSFPSTDYRHLEVMKTQIRYMYDHNLFKKKQHYQGHELLLFTVRETILILWEPFPSQHNPVCTICTTEGTLCIHLRRCKTFLFGKIKNKSVMTFRTTRGKFLWEKIFWNHHGNRFDRATKATTTTDRDGHPIARWHSPSYR